ncbi:MAG: hypothetical protein ACUZ8O_06390 [Candidatus Anammoxibacter sp.]
MPITKELKNIKTFESSGFTHEQAESLTDVIEESHADSQESLKEFIRNEFNKQAKDVDVKFSNLDNKLSQQMSNLEVNMATMRKDFSSQVSALDNRLSQQMSKFEVNMATSQKDLLVKIFAIIVGTVGVAVTIIKVF